MWIVGALLFAVAALLAFRSPRGLGRRAALAWVPLTLAGGALLAAAGLAPTVPLPFGLRLDPLGAWALVPCLFWALLVAAGPHVGDLPSPAGLASLIPVGVGVLLADNLLTWLVLFGLFIAIIATLSPGRGESSPLALPVISGGALLVLGADTGDPWVRLDPELLNGAPARLLGVLVFGGVAGLLPLSWAYPAACTRLPIAVSGVVVGFGGQIGLLGLTRLHAGTPELGSGLLLLGLGLASTVYAVVSMMREDDLRRFIGLLGVSVSALLAVSLGARVLGEVWGLPSLASGAAVALELGRVLHPLGLTLFTLALGMLYAGAGRTDIRDLGGLIRPFPVTATLFGLATWCLIALPPLATFLPDWSLLRGLIGGLDAAPPAVRVVLLAIFVMVVLARVATGLALLRPFAGVFLGPRRAPGGLLPLDPKLEWFGLAGLLVVPPAVLPRALSRAAAAHTVVGSAPDPDVDRIALLGAALVAGALLVSAFDRRRTSAPEPVAWIGGREATEAPPPRPAPHAERRTPDVAALRERLGLLLARLPQEARVETAWWLVGLLLALGWALA